MPLTNFSSFTLQALNRTLMLEKGTVVIIAGRVAPEAFGDQLLKCLNSAERKRLSRLRDAIQSRVYLSAHAVLNLVLAGFTGHPPSQLQFALGPERKPYLAPSEAGLYFNLSHSGKYFLIGLLQEREMGVDVEEHREGIAPETLAKRFFHPHEQMQLQKEAVSFFDIWARKEAFLKAQGTGLAYPTASFDATQECITTHSPTFCLGSLPLFPDASAAIAVEGTAMPALQAYRLFSEPDWKTFLNTA